MGQQPGWAEFPYRVPYPWQADSIADEAVELRHLSPEVEGYIESQGGGTPDDDSVGLQQLVKGYRRTSFAVNSLISGGARVLLEFALPDNHGAALLTVQSAHSSPIAGNGQRSVGSLNLGAASLSAAKSTTVSGTSSLVPLPSVVAFPDHTDAFVSAGMNEAESLPTGVAARALFYSERNYLFGWYSGGGTNSGLLSNDANSKVWVEGAWLDGDTLKVAVRSDAAGGAGPYNLNGTIHVVY